LAARLRSPSVAKLPSGKALRSCPDAFPVLDTLFGSGDTGDPASAADSQREGDIKRRIVEAERKNDVAALVQLKQEKLELDRKLAGI